MPILPVCDDSGNLLLEAPAIVFGRMLFPDRIEMQAHMEFAAIARFGIACGADFGPNALRKALAMPSQEWLKKEVDERFTVGIAVGHLYCWILRLAQIERYRMRASFNTVATIAADLLICQGVASKRTFQEWWELMEPVRHLWAAWVARGAIISNLPYFEDETGPRCYTATDNFAHFLMEASQAHELGVEYRPSSAPTATKTLSPSDTSLVMPDSWQPLSPLGPFGRFRLSDVTEDFLGRVEHLIQQNSAQHHKPRKK